MDPTQVKMLLALLVPILDAIVAGTPNPVDNIAWLIIKKTLLSDKVAQELHTQMSVHGLAKP